MILFKDFKSQVYHVLECSSTSNGKLGLDEIMLLAIYHLNQDDNGFPHLSDKSILLTEGARMLLFSVARKCLRDASSEATLVVSCYILNSLAQVVTENEQSINILKLCYHLISIASTSSFRNRLEIATRGFNALSVVFFNLNSKQQQQRSKISMITPVNGRRRRKKFTTKEDCDSTKTGPTGDKENFSCKMDTLPVPNRPFSINEALNFRQLCKLIVGSILNLSQMFLLSSDHSTAFHLLSNNVIPWLRLLSEEKEDEKSKPDVSLYAQSCYRMVWDYAPSEKGTTSDVLHFKAFAIHCLFLKTETGEEENENQKTYSIFLADKTFESVCHDIYNSLLQSSFKLDPLLCTFHESVGYLLDQQASMLPSVTVPMSYVEYCFIRAVQLSQNQHNITINRNNPLTIFPFAEKKLDCECLQTVVLAITYLYLSRSQIPQHFLIQMLLANSEKLQSFITRSEHDSKLLYKCWKIFHQLNIISAVSEKITSFNEPSSSRILESPEESLLLIEAHVLSKCIAPLSLRLHHAITYQDSSSLIDMQNDTRRLIDATAENSESLLTFVSIIFQTEVQDCPTDHNISILSTAVDVLMKAAIIYEHLKLYHTTDFCLMKAASTCCCYHQINLLQMVSKGIATIGRKRLMLMNHTGTAILPLILSCHFFSSISLDCDEKQDTKKLALRYSSLASILALSYPEEATIAYALSIRYFLLSNELTSIHAPDISTDFSLLSSNTLVSENDAAFATLDKLHRHMFRKKGDKNTYIVVTDHVVAIQKALASSKVGILLIENRKLKNNFVSLLLTVLTEVDENTRKTISSVNILHLLRVSISFLGKEYQRHVRITATDGTENLAKSANIFKEFKDAVEFSISYVKNSYAHQKQLLANSSIYLFAAKSLFPQSMQVDGKTKAQSDSTPFNIKELLKEATRMGNASYELLIQADRLTATQIVTDTEAKISMTILTYLVHTSILLIDMSSTIDEPLPPEFYYNTKDPDSPIIYILNFCARAVTLVVTRDVNDIAAVKSLYTSLCQLHTKLFHSGSLVNAARAAYHAGMLDCRSLAVSSSTLALAGSDVLLEAELFDSSFKCLLFSNHAGVAKKLLPTSINALEDCAQLDRVALMAALEVQCGHHLKESINTLDIILSTTRQYCSNNSKATRTLNDDVAFLAHWIRTTCLLFIASADVKCGRLVDALTALKECSVVCKENIKLCRLLVVQETGLANQGRIFVGSRWIGRLSSCLMSMSMCFSRLGDRRRAEGYSMASLEALGLHFNQDDRQKVDWLSCRAAGATREYCQINELSLSSKVLDEGQKERLFQHIKKRGITDSFSRSISGMHWKVEFIRCLIYRGDKLKRLSTQGVNNGFAECYNTAYKLLKPLLSAEYGPMIDEAIGFTARPINGTEKNTLDNGLRFDCRLGSLDSAIKLRLARCIEISGSIESLENADAVRLYEEVRQSPYSNGIDRAKSCYRLGRIFLEKAKRFGNLASLWKGHAEFIDATEEEENCSNDICHQATDASLDGNGYDEYLSRAVSFFREALSYTGRTTEKLTRHVLRSLALALGPTKGVRTSLPFICVSEAALLIHFSVGMSSRQLVSRMYADDTKFLSEHDKQVKEVFEVCSVDVLESDELLQKFLHVVSKLPKFWIITALSLAPSGEMLVSAIKSDGDGEVHARAMCIFPSQTCDSNTYFRNTLDEMESILESNRTQLSGMDPTTAKSFDKDATQKWWENRKTIDLELKHLIESFEKRCFSSRRLVDTLLCQQPVDQVLLPADLEAVFDQQCSVADKEAHDVSTSMECLHALKVVELKKKLEVEFGVEKKVIRRLKKADMIDLILSEQRRQKRTTSCTTSVCIGSSTITTDGSRDSRYSASNLSIPKPCTILVLDENLHRFPWENLPLLRGRQICRVPSLPFVIAPLVDTEQPHGSVDPLRSTYLIDPESNLTSTRHTLEEAINEICRKQKPPLKWNGAVGRIPPTSFFTEAMEQTNGLFLYCGHGGGESCFSRARVEEMLYNRKEESAVNHSGSSASNYRRCQSSIILMGCSSGSLSSGGAKGFSKQARPDYCFYEPEGIATWYLMAGAPCVIGNLWDVTDRDIDRYCIELLESFFVNITSSDKDGFSLAECVAKARDACKMRYIVGCAPVCYGVPVFLAGTSQL